MLCCCCQTLLAAAADRWTTAAKASSFANNLYEATLDEEFPVLYYNAGLILVYDDFICLEGASGVGLSGPGNIPSEHQPRNPLLRNQQRLHHDPAPTWFLRDSLRSSRLASLRPPLSGPCPARQCSRRLEPKAAAPDEK